MSSFAEVVALVEGPTEQRFVKQVLAPYLASRGVFLHAAILNKPGQKGGDVKFARAKNDVENFLNQRPGTYVTFWVDYYGIKMDWPGLDEATKKNTPGEKAEVINRCLLACLKELFSELRVEDRVIPYIAMHETEALLFSNPAVLAAKLNVNRSKVDAILQECGEPEAINNRWETKPAKRLESLNPRFKKTTMGVAIAEAISVDEMREKCPVFNRWITQLEQLGAES